MSVASLAQLVEQLIRNQQVKSSSLLAGSIEFSPHGENREGFFLLETGNMAKSFCLVDKNMPTKDFSSSHFIPFWI